MMKRHNYQRTLYLLTLSEEANYRSTHLEYLYSQIPFITHRIDTLDSLINNPNDLPHKIYVMDYDTVDIVMPLFKNKILHHNRGESVIINAPTKVVTDKIISYGNLRGLFYSSSQNKNIIKGLEEIVNGQLWLPRQIVSQLIHFYHYHFENNNLNAVMNLTTREMEILKCLESEGSNQKIADSLFISEPTVKSHLYQIYKKISVKNRSQAIAWLRNNCIQ